MKKADILLAVSALFLVFSLLSFPKELTAAATESLILWYKSVLPALFPFITACLVLLDTPFPKLTSKLFSPIMQKAFDLSGECAFPFICGALSGYPAGAKITANLLKNGSITKYDADRLMSFCNLPSPLFVISSVGVIFFGDKKFGFLLIACVFTASAATGVLTRFIYKKPTEQWQKTFACDEKSPSLGDAVSSAAETVLLVGGYMTLFGVIARSVELCGLPKSPILKTLLLGFLEMAQGAKAASSIALPLNIRLCLAASALAWGGLSINMQVASVTEKSEISMARYVFSKALCSILAFGVTYAVIFIKNQPNFLS